MELTDYRLYDKVAETLSSWEFNNKWPSSPVEIIEHLQKETGKLLPYLTTMHSLSMGRPDIKVPYGMRRSFNEWGGIGNMREHLLMRKCKEWIISMPPIPDHYFYGTYSSSNNRLIKPIPLNVTSLVGNFGLGSKNEVIQRLKYFCTLMGSPLTELQKREVGGRWAYVLGIPGELANYGF